MRQRVSFSERSKSRFVEWIYRAFWEQRWSVGLVEEEAFWRCVEKGTLSERNVNWLGSSNDFFLADPCWISEAEGLFAAECFDYRRRIGSIVLAKVANNEALPVGTIKLSDVHHSYPMVYAYGDLLLIIPESADGGSVCAIRLDRGGRAIEETVILSGFHLVDPNVFYHDGSYWMFANPLHNFDDEVTIFFGDSIIGPWHETEHGSLFIPNCRGAGRIFHKDGVLYWPTQLNSERYGGGVILRRINSLSANSFEHDIVSVIRPDPKGSRPLGFHTVTNGERHYLVDGLAYTFSPIKLLHVMISRVRRRLRNSAGRGGGSPRLAG
jgi:hypothetical protein